MSQNNIPTTILSGLTPTQKNSELNGVDEALIAARKEILRASEKAIMRWLGARDLAHAIEIIEHLKDYGYRVDVDEDTVVKVSGENEYFCSFETTVHYKLVKI